jgi:hypothetical protein
VSGTALSRCSSPFRDIIDHLEQVLGAESLRHASFFEPASSDPPSSLSALISTQKPPSAAVHARSGRRQACPLETAEGLAEATSLKEV